jgi:hypothetical protein
MYIAPLVLYTFKPKHVAFHKGKCCSYNKTGSVRITELKRVHETTVAVEQQKACLPYFCACACGLTNPACNAPPYCHLRPLWPHHFFQHHLMQGTIFGKTLLNIKCVFWLSLQLLFEKFLILSRIQRDTVINVKMSSRKVPVILVGFEWKSNFLDRFSLKYLISSKSVL